MRSRDEGVASGHRTCVHEMSWGIMDTVFDQFDTADFSVILQLKLKILGAGMGAEFE